VRRNAASAWKSGGPCCCCCDWPDDPPPLPPATLPPDDVVDMGEDGIDDTDCAALPPIIPICALWLSGVILNPKCLNLGNTGAPACWAFDASAISAFEQVFKDAISFGVMQFMPADRFPGTKHATLSDISCEHAPPECDVGDEDCMRLSKPVNESSADTSEDLNEMCVSCESGSSADSELFSVGAGAGGGAGGGRSKSANGCGACTTEGDVDCCAAEAGENGSAVAADRQIFLSVLLFCAMKAGSVRGVAADKVRKN